jgi:hypothetical protein
MCRTAKVLALSSMLGSLAFGSSALAEDASEIDLTGTWEVRRYAPSSSEENSPTS